MEEEKKKNCVEKKKKHPQSTGQTAPKHGKTCFYLRLAESSIDVLRLEEGTLCALNHLLVDRLGRVVHDNSPVLVVNLCVDASVADKIDNPLLTVLLGKVKAGSEVLDIDTLVNLAVAFRDEVAGRVDKRLGRGNQEEVALENLLGLTELALGLFEIKVDTERGNKLGDGVTVLVKLLLDDTDEILELLLVGARVAGAIAVGDYRSGEVPEDPGARGLDGVDESGGEEELDQDIAGGVVVEEGEQSPMDEESAVLELRKRVVVELGMWSICGSRKPDLWITFCSIRSLTLVTSSIAASQLV